MSSTPVGWKFWRDWIIFCTLGGIVGFVMSVPVWIGASYRDVLRNAIGWAVIGVFWGLAQWVVLDQHLLKANYWILATIADVLISLAIAEPTLAFLGRLIGWAAIGAVGAIFQYLVLRRHFLWASSWLLASAAGVAISMAVVEVLFKVVAKAVIGQPAGGDSGLSALARVMETIVGGVAGLAVGGSVGLAIYGMITGGVLVWLFRHPKITEHN